MKLTAHDRKILSAEPDTEPEDVDAPDARTIDGLGAEELADVRRLIEQRGWTNAMVAWRHDLTEAQVYRLCKRDRIKRPIALKTTRSVSLARVWDLLGEGQNPHAIARLLEQNYQQVYADSRRLRAMSDEKRSITIAFENDLEGLEREGFDRTILTRV